MSHELSLISHEISLMSPELSLMSHELSLMPHEQSLMSHEQSLMSPEAILDVACLPVNQRITDEKFLYGSQPHWFVPRVSEIETSFTAVAKLLHRGVASVCGMACS